MADNNHDEIHIDEEDVSGGSKEGVVRWVLGVGLVLAVVAMSLIWIIPALMQGDAEEEATVAGTMEATSEDEGDGTDGVVLEEDLGDEGFSESEAEGEDGPEL
ncbi:hypothetical protein [Alteriqipengyuania lutimaris]|uniref:Uncharacterized protein n=1 Tax=Alteriqipengyuania lutimaris TaxID=1538146 RepID=A0A395LH25_9SPHN|nr:hypothetical protein [Alteriqipengyuania lutimaris]MBB3034975.1 hypothetical protein [Alteriqipengyuania lutimaris]RDS76206.1 hypothetical protein DL238_00290 [Alteriqipengyuania lutimaris]